ncbi:TonB-dependent receptor plug domain-containing protein [Altererythrobacter sp. C41]|uniref:TonB-dependent receptor plug domain-containing protein n=1 Tax=Altererythrobacter sp. C41 TaxID=2806021 RepID=UPI0019332E34|nr:TonB-dependent receptor [Altererythrobacter sp. C41]
MAAASVLEDRRSNRVQGELPAEEALARLLAGSGLTVQKIEGALVLRAAGQLAPDLRAPKPEPIVVTGTRIRGSGPVGSTVITVDREELDRSGRATLADFVRTIPQNFSGGPAEANVGTTARGNATSNIGFGTGVNLRGLGPGSTLTLIDGTRPALGGASGAFADLSLIPAAAIERIEILTDGASAIYGSDAVAGVVNIRLRNRFEGVEARLRAGTADGDLGTYQASQIVGRRWGGGHVVVAGEYYQRGRLPSHKRAYATEDLRPFGGPDLRSNYGNPGTIVAANGAAFRIPAGQDGTDLTPDELIPGGFNLGDARRHVDLLPRQETVSLYGSGEQNLGGGFSLFARALYAKRRFEARRRVLGISPLTITPSHPYYVDPIGTGENIRVYYDPVADFGPEGVKGTVRAFNAILGGRAELGRWSLELSGGYGVQREGYEAVNLVHLLRLARAVAATDPAWALNPFGDGSVNDPALIDSLRGSLGKPPKMRGLEGIRKW